MERWFSATGRVLLAAAALLGNVVTASDQLKGTAPEGTPGTAGASDALSLDEWQKQLQADSLPPEQISVVASLALRAQADDSKVWNPKWGDFVELARNKGRLPEEVWRDYLLNAVRFRVRVASSATREGGLMLWIEQERARSGSRGEPATATGIFEEDLSGIPIEPTGHSRSQRLGLTSGGGGGSGRTIDLKDKRFAALTDGPQTCHYRCRIEIADRGSEPAKPGKILGERIVEDVVPWQLLAPRAEPLLPQLIADPSLRSKIEKSVHINYILRDDRDKGFVQAFIQVDHPPVDMAFEASLRAGGDSWFLGPVAWARGEAGWWAFDLDLPAAVDQVDVALTPSASAAAKLAHNWRHTLFDIRTIWDGPEIVIPAVKVSSQRVHMQRLDPPPRDAAIAYAVSEMDPVDPAGQQLKRSGDLAAARDELEQRTREHPADSLAQYELGCVLTAEGTLNGAMGRFLTALNLDPPAALRRQIQRQQRRLCSQWLWLAESGNASAMGSLGGAYEHGWCVAVDVESAKRWYRNASNAGDAPAMSRLAFMYEHKLGATMHTGAADAWYKNEALKWYGKAASRGEEEAKQWITSHSQ